MNAFAAARLDRALDSLDVAVRLLDGPIDRCARSVLIKAREDIVAMRDLLDHEDALRERHEAMKIALVRGGR